MQNLLSKCNRKNVDDKKNPSVDGGSATMASLIVTQSDTISKFDLQGPIFYFGAKNSKFSWYTSSML